MHVPHVSYTPAEAALQAKVSPWTIRRWIRTGELPAVQVGGRIRIEPDARARVIHPTATKETR
jgi:excisionase family DNA binding protein